MTRGATMVIRTVMIGMIRLRGRGLHQGKSREDNEEQHSSKAAPFSSAAGTPQPTTHLTSLPRSTGRCPQNVGLAG